MAAERVRLENLARQIWPWIYQAKKLPGPGVENTAYLSEYLSPQTPIGPGIANRRQYWFQTPTTFAPHLIGVQGIGGLIHGQFYGTPLVDVNSNGQFG